MGRAAMSEVPAIDARTLKARLRDGGEIALLDVREHGQYGEGHPFLAVPLPYSRLEIDIGRLVPNRAVRMVLVDHGDGVAARAAARARALGYRDVAILAGGAPAWAAAGFTLFKGVNVPSKAFGELVEEVRRTPHITPGELVRRRRAGDAIVVVDGRPQSEFTRMSIPGAVCCPNGELAWRIATLAPDPATTVVVNCAGRTRSIIGAETLREIGIANPVLALENGTQGWHLAGEALDHGARATFDPLATAGSAARERACAFALRHGVDWVEAAAVSVWLGDEDRTTYVLDVRTQAEYEADGLAGSEHAPGGQLVQATDQWIGVRGARVVLVDGEDVRAPVTAAWLRRLGHEAHVLAGGVASGLALPVPSAGALPPALPAIDARAAAAAVASGALKLIDLRSSMAYRKRHAAGAAWGIRPRIAEIARDGAGSVAVFADDARIVSLAALDLREADIADVRAVYGGLDAWQDAGLPVAATPAVPSDAAAIDYLFFVHDRHDGNAEAARQYLAWERGLVAALDADERSIFRI